MIGFNRWFRGLIGGNTSGAMKAFTQAAKLLKAVESVNKSELKIINRRIVEVSAKAKSDMTKAEQTYNEAKAKVQKIEGTAKAKLNSLAKVSDDELKMAAKYLANIEKVLGV